MRVRFVAAFAALALALPTTGSAGPQAPAVVDLPDTPLSSPNVHLVTTLHTGSGVGGKFATIAGKPYYFQTTVRSGFFTPSGVGTGGVVALDVTNPEQPVVAGALPIPLTQNEDVELSEARGLLLFSGDTGRVNNSACGLMTNPQVGPHLTDQERAVLCRRVPGRLVVVDISNPTAMRVRSTLAYPATTGFRDDGMPNGGPGHTASCILDCNYVYVVGGRNRGAHVVDLRDPDSPKIVGEVKDSPAGADANGYRPGLLHDVHTDKYGNVWFVGSGGSAMYAPITDPLKPRLLAAVSAADNKKHNQLIHHGALRLDKSTVLIGEEDFATDNCGSQDGKGDQDGSLQTWKIDTRAKRLVPLASWDAELATTYQGALANSAGISCTSHWFDVNAAKVVADGFYEQGVRFLDVSNPRKIRQVGYWIAPATAASQAQYVPGRPDLVYVADYSRGLDVLRIDSGGRAARTVTAPVRAEWLKGYRGVSFVPAMERDETYGFACKRPVTD